MDIAGKDLFQLCQSVNTGQLNLRVTTTQGPISYYLLDRLGVTDHGTSLHRLLATHRRPHVVVDFLQQSRAHEEYLSRNTRLDQRQDIVGDSEESFASFATDTSRFHGMANPPPSIRAQNMKGATALHVAAFRNSAHVGTIIDILLEWDAMSSAGPSLASIPMNCGSCPLHILTGQNTTIQQHALESLVMADPAVVQQEDVNGDNPLSLLWKNTLRFRWAISIMEGSTYIDYIHEEDGCSWITIISPQKFICFSRFMIEATFGKSKFDNNENGITIHELCSIPRCPPMIFRLSQSPEYGTLLGITGDVHTLDQQGMLPLHHAVQTKPATYHFVPHYLKREYRTTLVGLLLEAYPESARVADVKGRLPLHYALESGYLDETDLLTLVKLYPDSLRVQDPLSGLYPFMLVAAQASQSFETTTASSLSMFNPLRTSDVALPQNMIMTTRENSDVFGQSETGWKNENVRMSFLLLMLCPEAVQFNNICQCN